MSTGRRSETIRIRGSVLFGVITVLLPFSVFAIDWGAGPVGSSPSQPSQPGWGQAPTTQQRSAPANATPLPAAAQTPARHLQGPAGGNLKTINDIVVALTTPRIAGVDGEITPGAKILIRGSGFGQVDGTLTLSGLSNPNASGQPDILYWYDDHIGASIPKSLTGVTDSIVSLTVKTSDGKTAVQGGISFKATKELKKAYAPAVTVKQCNSTDCYTFPTPNPNNPDGKYIQSISGHHCSVFGDKGDDSFRLSLRNGWTVKEVKIDKEFPLPLYGGNSSIGDAVQDGDTLTIHWYFDNYNPFNLYCLRYYGHVYITGPAGLPYF